MEILQCKIYEKGRIFKKGTYSELVFYIRGQVGVGQVVVGQVVVGQVACRSCGCRSIVRDPMNSARRAGCNDI